jgi:hypothetical protein
VKTYFRIRQQYQGFVVIESPVDLDVVTVYTAAGSTGQIETFHTERVLPLPRQVQPSRLPDLVPVKPLGTPGPGGFCKLDSQGRLLVSVRNQGSADAAASTTKVEFFPGGPRLLPTPPLVPGRLADLPPIDMPKACFNPNCRFQLTVDANNELMESNEGNNRAEGMCAAIP